MSSGEAHDHRTAHGTRHTASQSKPNSEEAKIDLIGRAITVKAIQIKDFSRGHHGQQGVEGLAAAFSPGVVNFPPS